MWILRCYDPGGKGGGFHSWLDSLIPEVQSEIDNAFEILVPLSDWRKTTTYEDLRGACEGLGEVKVDVTRNWNDGGGTRTRMFRILVFHGPDRREVTLLYGFEKITGSEYSHACPAALQRKEGVLRDGRRAPICSFP